MESEPLSGEAVPLCGPHRLRYDPRTQRGCVLCRRDLAADAGRPRAERSGRTWAGPGFCCVLTAIAVLLWMRALPVLQRDGAEQAALGRIEAPRLDATEPGAAALALAKQARERGSAVPAPLGNPYNPGLDAALARTLQDAATRAWIDQGSPRAP
jgi:hypothetical protein